MRSGTVRVLVVAVLLLGMGVPVLAEELVNMEFRQAPLADVLQILGQLGGYNVLVDPSVQGEVSFVLNDLPVQEALDLVTRTTGYRYQLVGNTLVFASEQRLKSEFGTESVRFVGVEHVSADAARGLVSLVVPSVRSFVDAERNLVVLYGLESDLKVAEQVLKEYDRQAGSSGSAVAEVPAVEFPDQGLASETLVFQAVTIEYADGQRILDMVRQLLPQREFRFHVETGLLTARATAEEWEVLKALIEQHDLPDIVLKGILRSGEQKLALVEHRGTAYSLQVGEELLGWRLRELGEGTAEFEFSQGGRRFTVRVGR